MQGMRLIRYQEWSENEGKVIRTIYEQSVPNDEVFVRKLVNATVMRNQVFEHTSHESEDRQRHIVYAKPFNESDLDLYGTQIKPPLFDCCAPSDSLEPEFIFWNGHMFIHGELLLKLGDTLDIAQLLLDHYIIIKERTFETIYTILDTDRNKVAFYMKEVFY